MSKIGQRIIIIPEGVCLSEEKDQIKVTGSKGELILEIPREIKLQKSPEGLSVQRNGNNKRAKAFHGLYRKLIANMVEGVSVGFTKKLDFKGVGFKAEVKDKQLILNVGFSHQVEYKFSEEIEIIVEKNVISVSGINRQKVGQAAAEIRAIRPVEPYKGKGIKYIDEVPRRKLGKAAKTATPGGA